MGIDRKAVLKIASIIFTMAAFTSLLAVLDPSHDQYPPPPDVDPGVFEKLWSFDWGKDLNLTIEQLDEWSYSGTEIMETRVEFSLKPDTPECRISGFIYSSKSSSPSDWVILVHGLGGDHTFFEEEIGGVILPLELASLGYTVMAIDAAGHGESCIPGGESWVDRAGVLEPGEFFLYYVYLSGVRAVEAALALGAEEGRIAVSGVSMGGLTSYAVASLHPAVSLAIPIVASGCFNCMILSGGLANLVGPADAAFSEETALSLAYVDPLTYISEGSVDGKLFYILFSGHDEFFPTEGLAATVDGLRAAGASVYLAFDGNNNHYKAPPEWVSSAIEVLKAFKEGGVEEAEEALGSRAASAPGLTSFLTGGGEWRPAADGLYYLPGVPILPLLLSGEVVDKSKDIPITASTPEAAPAPLKYIATLAWFALAYMAATHSGVPRRRVQAMLALTLAAALLYSLPFWAWSGRFSLGILSLMERYAVTPQDALGLPTSPILTLLILAAPAAIAVQHTTGRRAVIVVTAIILLLATLAPFILMRLVLGEIEARSPQDLPTQIYPLELAGILLAGLSTLLALRFAKREST